MSSGALSSMAQALRAEEAAGVTWLPVEDLARDEAARDAAASLHWRVELPSRRMYIEAAGRVDGAAE